MLGLPNGAEWGILAIIVALNAVMGLITLAIGSKKGLSRPLSFCAGFFFNWVGLLIVAIIPGPSQQR